MILKHTNKMIFLISIVLFLKVCCGCVVIHSTTDVVVSTGSTAAKFVQVPELTPQDEGKAFLRVTQHATADVDNADRILAKAKLIFDLTRRGMVFLPLLKKLIFFFSLVIY